MTESKGVRKKLAIMIEDLYSGNISWEEYDEFLLSNKLIMDDAAVEIAQFIWRMMDPEYPCNEKQLTTNLIDRIILYLGSDKMEIGKLYYGKSKLSFGWLPPRLNCTYDEINEFWPFLNEGEYISYLRSYKS